MPPCCVVVQGDYAEIKTTTCSELINKRQLSLLKTPIFLALNMEGKEFFTEYVFRKDRSHAFD